MIVMAINVVNFFLVYVFSGFILSKSLDVLFKKKLQGALTYIVGFGIAPLFIALIQYYLYWLWPHNEWFFYAIIQYSFWFFLLCGTLWRSRKIKNDHSNIQAALKRSLLAIQQLNTTSKILCVFILFTVGFVFLRGQLYPPTWGDVILYLQQGRVYGVDHSLERLTTFIPFVEDGTGYVMNPTIRPAIPILYSFFYTQNKIDDAFIFSGMFLYFYYFCLVLLLFSYILKTFRYNNNDVVFGLTLLLSTYYFINFLIYGFKEIILIYLLLLALFLHHELRGQVVTSRSYRAMILGIALGLIVNIHYSGFIIAGIVGLLYLFQLITSKISFRTIISTFFITIITIIFISGSEIQTVSRFIFNGKIFTPKQPTVTETNELTSYRFIPPSPSDPTDISSDPSPVNPSSVYYEEEVQEIQTTTDSSSIDLKYILLLKGKLQGFTQPQFYGLIFWLFFTVVILSLIKKKSWSPFEKYTLGFIILFSLIVIDPFFINQHPQAYVLAVSPKYTILLVPFLVMIITMRYGVVIDMLVKINLKYLLVLPVMMALFIPSVRDVIVQRTFDVVEKIMPIYQTPGYYFEKLHAVYFLLGLLSIFFSIGIIYYLKKGIDTERKIILLNFIALVGMFIFPFLFLLNSNYAIATTMKYLTASTEEKIVATSSASPEAEALFYAIIYLRKHTDSSKGVFLLYPRYYFYYLEHDERFLYASLGDLTLPVNQTAKMAVNIADADYVVLSKTNIERYDFGRELTELKDFDEVVVLQVVDE